MILINYDQLVEVNLQYMQYHFTFLYDEIHVVYFIYFTLVYVLYIRVQF